jgi:hypothetical protein
MTSAIYTNSIPRVLHSKGSSDASSHCGSDNNYSNGDQDPEVTPSKTEDGGLFRWCMMRIRSVSVRSLLCVRLLCLVWIVLRGIAKSELWSVGHFEDFIVCTECS